MPNPHPGLSDTEFQVLAAIRERGGRGSGWRVLAGELNRMRTADVYSPEVVWSRCVSHEWLRAAYAVAAFKRQNPMTVKTLNELSRAMQASSVKTAAVGTVHHVSNAETVRNEQPFPNVQVIPGAGVSGQGVESEQKDYPSRSTRYVSAEEDSPAVPHRMREAAKGRTTRSDSEATMKGPSASEVGPVCEKCGTPTGGAKRCPAHIFDRQLVD